MSLLYHFKCFIIHLGVSDILLFADCHLVIPTLGCTLPVRLLPHEEKVGKV